ncbi:MAG: hypothetical protein V4443_06385 [Pseudomonadota bacterium]
MFLQIARLLTITSTIFLLSCVTTQRFEELLNSWVGNDGYKLEKAGWGKLEQVTLLPNGNSEHVYNIIEGNSIPDTCLAFFEVDKQTQKIIRVRHEGNRCKLGRTFL